MKNSKKYLIVVAGPTASGKTATAIHLAKHYQTVVLSADSRQFYREMQIGTAKPRPEEMEGVPHYFIDSLGIHEDYSVGDFEKEALQALNEVFQSHQLAILTGGSGLFIQAVCQGLDAFPEVPLEVRNKLETLYREKGLTQLQQYLQKVDPAYFEEVDIHNPHRLIRALAVYEASGKPYSSFRNASPAPRPFTPIYLLLEWDRTDLYRRIDQRVDQMVADGLVEEVKKLYPHRAYNALQTVGYQELFNHFDGAYSLEEAIDLIKQHSRNYAKRQGTWFRKQADWARFSAGDYQGMIDYIDDVSYL